jgi:hypothetical protein
MSRPYGIRLSSNAGAPAAAGSAVGRGDGATGTIRSESVLARNTGTDGRLAAVQVRGFAAAGASSFLAVFGFPPGSRIPEGGPFEASSFAAIGREEEPLPASEEIPEERPDGGRAAGVEGRWYQ